MLIWRNLRPETLVSVMRWWAAARERKAAASASAKEPGQAKPAAAKTEAPGKPLVPPSKVRD